MPTSSGNALRVLVADDEKNIRVTLALALETAGCAVAQASTSAAALEAAARERFDLAFLDLRLGTESGLDLLVEHQRLAVVIISRQWTRGPART